MLSFIKEKLHKVYDSFTTKIHALFGRTTIDEATIKELEILLISADTGVKTTRTIIEKLRQDLRNGKLGQGSSLRSALEPILLDILSKQGASCTNARIYLLVGINGSGKTTFAGKLAHYFSNQGKKVLLVAADTFRAAAQEQLTRWAIQSNVDIVLGKQNQDPASVVFSGCEKFNNEGYDRLIIDTAGRLQTKVNLMKELAKIKRIIGKHMPDEKIQTLLTIDAMLGQNSFEQAKLFKESTNVSGIVLTKMDGSGKGGIVFSIVQELDIPISYITFGEQRDEFKGFNAKDYVTGLLN